MSEVTGILIDTTGIQKYIFSSNKLKLNLGASFIIEHLLMDQLLLKTLNNFGPAKKDSLDDWLIRSEEPQTKDGTIGLGYNGGGRCLLFCKDGTIAEDFASQFSLQAMVHFPGITLSATTLEYMGSAKDRKDNDKTAFQVFMNEINSKLNNDHSRYHIISTPISPGYVRKDLYSNEYVDPEATKNSGLNIKLKEKNKNKNKSITTLSRLAYVNEANQKHKSDFLENQKYDFPLDLDDVCMEKDQGFIAVVHIDGNGIGRQFMKMKNLKEFQELSGKVKDIGRKVITQTVKDLIELLEHGHKGNGIVAKTIEDFQKNKWDKGILPFRPIISGGDDITFVTDGRLGIYLAEKCVKNFISITKDVLGEEFHACAGVAIVKRKYPFGRAYHLAEELIANAKQASRAPHEEKYSFIDVYISKSGISGSLDFIRSQTHEMIDLDKIYRMDYGPYLLDHLNGETDGKPLFKDFIIRMEETLASTSMSKVQQLRDALYGTTSAREAYIARLGEVDVGFKDKLTKNGSSQEDEILFTKSGGNYITPWIDAIDFRDFYPLNGRVSKIPEKKINR